jgi:hypothetical protein
MILRMTYIILYNIESVGETMKLEAWQLAAMEEAGCMDTNDGLVNCVARYLAQSNNEEIDAQEFRKACIACNVDPDSFTQKDLHRLQKKLSKLT